MDLFDLKTARRGRSAVPETFARTRLCREILCSVFEIDAMVKN